MSSPSNSNLVGGERLRSLIERVEQLREEKRNTSDREKQVYAEAKADGYTPKYIRAIVRLREKPPSEREEDEAMMDMYLAAIGMARETPLFRSIEGMGVDAAAKDSVLKALRLIAPQDGEITVKVAGSPRMRIWRDDKGEVQMEEVSDAPPAPMSASPSAASPPRAGAGAPDCTENEAFDLGRNARRADQPVISNPFAWDDKRRRRWDEGWREEDGGDGMGPK